MIRYGFTIDGERLAKQVRKQIQADLAANGELPQGMELVTPVKLARLSGKGEVWVDAKGLPRRQILHVNVPRASEFYDARLLATMDFTDYGKVGALPQPVQDAGGDWRLEIRDSQTG
jgi:hypothetical protein